MRIVFDRNAAPSDDVERSVAELLKRVSTLEVEYKMPVIVFQDGAKGAYYTKCSFLASDAATLCDLNARLDPNNPESLKANRELMLKKHTYLKMEKDATAGREFNDIIVEYNTDYDFDTPFKVWGGQHRISAISRAGDSKRYHGFRVYFNLSKGQRSDLALTSNTNIAVSSDTFDRMVEETIFGNELRQWCQTVGLLDEGEDFPDTGARSEKITVKRARSFVVNFYLGRELGKRLGPDELDARVYEPYLAATGTTIDPKYEEIMNANDILGDEALIEAGHRFTALHNAQNRAVTSGEGGIKNWKGYRNKALVESVLCGWSYVAGLLQSHPERLENHYRVPRTTSKVPDPLNAEEMSEFKHQDYDKPTYRGLGTRSAIKDRRRIAQLFLAKSLEKNVVINKRFMTKVVSRVIGLVALSDGYK